MTVPRPDPKAPHESPHQFAFRVVRFYAWVDGYTANKGGAIPPPNPYQQARPPEEPHD